MTMWRPNRRQALLQTLAMAGAGALPHLPFACPAAAAVARNNEIDRLLKARVDAGQIPGVVAMAATEGAILYEGAFGLRCMGAQAKMSGDTIFRIASMVKLLTSVAAMQLVEGGKLSLDEPAERIDPTLASPLVLEGFDAKGAPQLRPARKPVTLRNLLTHTSGFSYPLWDENVMRYLRAAHHDKKLPKRPLMFDPDSRWSYGGGLDRVSRLVEIASGESIDHYFRGHICGPLRMTNTAFEVNAQQRAHEANLHVRQSDGTLKPKPLEKPLEGPKVFSGGGGIYSTAPDYLTLLQALLNKGSLRGATILQPDTVALMSKNQIGDIRAGIMKTTNPALSNDVDFFPGNRLRWGFGSMINLDPVEGGRKAGSLTWAGLYNTYYWIDPTSGVAGVIMMQILPFADTRALEVYRQFERGVYRALKAA
jgi:CubicO group peptidase (beta-lactamase class C family)